jgi:hypothetical protein
MTSKRILIRHVFDGGWATDFGPTSDVSPDGANVVRLPFLETARNIVYELDGSPRKAPGTIKLHDTELESGAVIKGLFDFWLSGTGGASTQHRVIHVGTKAKKDDADGAFTDLFTGLTADAVPSYAVLNDLLVLTNDVDVPKSWDGSTAQNLAGTPPNFSFAATHKNRMWAAGVGSTPSRLNYCVSLDPEDWVGSGSGSIDIDPDDGDRITAIISHKNDLWVFKGPYKGSIHRITGSAPTGDDAFARTTFIEGLGAVGQNTLFRYHDDIGFMWSDGSIHSLKATAAFGDFNEASLSRPINTNYLGRRLNFSRLKHAWAAPSSTLEVVLFAVPVDGATDNNQILVMDHRFDPPRWSEWPGFSDVCGCLASVIDSGANNRRIVMAGGNDGFVRKMQQTDRSIDGDTAITYQVKTPFLNYSIPIEEKTVRECGLGVVPRNIGAITFGYQRDANAQQTREVTTASGDVLAPATVNQFTLGTSVLGGGSFVNSWFTLEDAASFRSIQYEILNAGNYEDVEVHSFSVALEGGAWSTENA